MIIAYTGRGKGKTSASVGQAIRAMGSGLSVAYGQFLKRPGCAGEQFILKKLLGENFLAAGAGFFRSPEQRDAQRAKVLEVLRWAHARQTRMLILDEALLALERGLLEKGELEDFLPASGKPDLHLVLTGPSLPQWLGPSCDIITEMHCIAHAHNRGVSAICGVEY